MNLKGLIRNVPDFPSPGIQFKDITTLIKNPMGFREAISSMADIYKNSGISKVVGVESRGFIFGAPVAVALNAGIVMVRKKGKLPSATVKVSYSLEYGTDTLEMHEDSVEPGEKVLIIDDLLATGGTIKATIELLNKFNADIAGICFLIELEGLNGREKLKPYKVDSIIKYDEV